MRRFLWVLLWGLIVPPCLYAETEIHREQADGSIQVEVIRTPGEQQMAEHAYQLPNGTTAYYMDSFNQRGGAVSKEVYEAQVMAIGQRVMNDGDRILDEAHAYRNSGNMSEDEYLQLHSSISVMKGNIREQQSSIKQSLAQAKPMNENAPHRTVKVVTKEQQKPRVLVA